MTNDLGVSPYLASPKRNNEGRRPKARHLSPCRPVIALPEGSFSSLPPQRVAVPAGTHMLGTPSPCRPRTAPDRAVTGYMDQSQQREAIWAAAAAAAAANRPFLSARRRTTDVVGDVRPLSNSPYAQRRWPDDAVGKGQPHSPASDRMPWSSQGRPRSAGLHRMLGTGERWPGSKLSGCTRLPNLEEGQAAEPIATGGHTIREQPGPKGTERPTGKGPNGGESTTVTANSRPCTAAAAAGHRHEATSARSAAARCHSTKTMATPSPFPSIHSDAPQTSTEMSWLAEGRDSCDVAAAAHASASTSGASLTHGEAEVCLPEPTPGPGCADDVCASPSPGKSDYGSEGHPSEGGASPPGVEVQAAGQMADLSADASPARVDGLDWHQSPASSFLAASDQSAEPQEADPSAILQSDSEAMVAAAGQEAAPTSIPPSSERMMAAAGREEAPTSIPPSSGMMAAAAGREAAPTSIQTSSEGMMAAAGQEAAPTSIPPSSEGMMAAAGQEAAPTGIPPSSEKPSSIAASGLTDGGRRRSDLEDVLPPLPLQLPEVSSGKDSAGGSDDGTAEDSAKAGAACSGNSSAGARCGSEDEAATRVTSRSTSCIRDDRERADGAALEGAAAGGTNGGSDRGSGGNTDGVTECIVAEGKNNTIGRDVRGSDGEDGGRGSDGGQRGGARPTRLREELLPPSSSSTSSGDFPFAAMSISEAPHHDVEIGELGLILSLLYSASVPERWAAATALRIYTLKPENHRSAIEAGAIPTLVSILSSSSGSLPPEELLKAAEVEALAAGILGQLSRSCAAEVAAAPGAIPALIGAMGSSSCLVALAEQSARTLQVLFMSPDLRVVSGSAGSAGSVLDPQWREWDAALVMLRDYVAGAMVCLLASSRSSTLQQCALGVVGALSSSGGEGALASSGGGGTSPGRGASASGQRTSAVAATAVPLVVALLASDTASVREHAAAAVAALAWGDASIQACAAKAGAIPMLVGLLKPLTTLSVRPQEGKATSPSQHQVEGPADPHSRQQEHAAGALSAVVWHHMANQDEAVAAGAVPLLVALLVDAASSETVKEHAAGSLWSLAVGNASVKAAVAAAAGAVAALVQLAGDGTCSAALRANAKGALNCLRQSGGLGPGRE